MARERRDVKGWGLIAPIDRNPPIPHIGKPSVAALISRMLGLGWRYRRACVVVVLLNVALVATQVGGLGLAGLGIDVVRHATDPTGMPPHWPWGLAPPSDWAAAHVVAAIAVLVVAVALANAGLKCLVAIASANLSQRVLIQLRTDVYDKLQRLSFRFHDSTDSSSLVNRAAGDVQAVRTFVDSVIVKVLTVTLSLSIYLAYMLSVHVTLTAVCLLTSPLLVGGAILFSRLVQPQYRRGSLLVDRLILTLAENIQGAHVVKGFAREPEQIAKFTSANREIRDQKSRIFWFTSTYQPLMGLLTQINTLVLLALGGYLVIRGQVALGSGLFVLVNLLQEFTNQVGQITNIASTIQSSLVGAERVFEVLDAPIEITSPPRAVRLPGPGIDLVRGRVLCLSRWPARVAGCNAAGGAGPVRGYHGRDRGGQEHAARPAAAVLRCRRRIRASGRARCAETETERPASQHRHGLPGQLSLQPHGGS